MIPPPVDALVAVFIQFLPPDARAAAFARFAAAIRPGGLLLLHGEGRLQVEIAGGLEFVRGVGMGEDLHPLLGPVAVAEHGVALVGGDTTAGDAVVASIHMTGEVEPGKALLRSDARAGDTVYVTGTVGDAAAGLSLFDTAERSDVLVQRFLRPVARIDTGRALGGRAHGAIDISDGLVGDLRKVLDASGVGAELDVDRVPLSEALR